jgi:hypothetical protein
MTSYPPIHSFPGALPYGIPYLPQPAPFFFGGGSVPAGVLPAGIVPPGTIIAGHGFPAPGLPTSTRTVESALPQGLQGSAPDLPGDKLSKAECIQFGVPEGAVWGRVGGDNAEPEYAPEESDLNEDDVRGTQV